MNLKIRSCWSPARPAAWAGPRPPAARQGARLIITARDAESRGVTARRARPPAARLRPRRRRRRPDTPAAGARRGPPLRRGRRPGQQRLRPGGDAPAGAEGLPPGALERALRINAFAPLHLIQLVLPGMLRRGRGVIVNVTSDAAVEAYPGWGGYGACKAALEALTRVLGRRARGQRRARLRRRSRRHEHPHAPGGRSRRRPPPWPTRRWSPRRSSAWSVGRRAQGRAGRAARSGRYAARDLRRRSPADWR